MSDKRSHLRFPVRLVVLLVHPSGESEGHSRDLGLGGMFVHTSAILPFGTQLEVRVSLPDLKVPSTLPATVRWQCPDGMGLQWRSLRARDVWALNRLFDRVEAELGESG